MDLFVYSDESGVFDKEHNEIYVYGGLIFLGKQQKDVFTRKYIVAERSIRRGKYAKDEELKACKISNSEKRKAVSFHERRRALWRHHKSKKCSRTHISKQER